MIVAVIAVAIGVWLRFDELGTKIYGFDETITSLRAAGHSMNEYERFAFDGRRHSAGELRRFQTVDPGTTSGSTVRSLASEDPQHPPVFYVLQRWSAPVFGESIAARRILPAMFSVLTIAAAFWLGAALFGSSARGWCPAALVAVSPFHVVYAQQAREYSLWSLLTLLSSAVLIEAQRRGRAGWYVAYGFTVALGLYAFPLFGAVMIGHAVYVAWLARSGTARIVVPYAVATGAAAIAFGPWLAIIVSNHHVIAEGTTWLAQSLSPQSTLAKWAFGAATSFFDLEYAYPWLLPAALLVIAIEAYAVVALWRTPGAARAFIVPLILTTAVLLVVPDLLFHQSRSTAIRYLTPTWIGLELAVAWLLVRPAASSRTAAIRASLFVGLLVAGIASDAVSARAGAWWLDTNDAPLKPIAAAIAASHGTIVYSGDPYYMLEMSNLLPPSTAFQLVRGSATHVAGGGYAVASKAELKTAELRSAERIPLAVPLPAGARRFGGSDDRFVIELRRIR